MAKLDAFRTKSGGVREYLDCHRGAHVIRDPIRNGLDSDAGRVLVSNVGDVVDVGTIASRCEAARDARDLGRPRQLELVHVEVQPPDGEGWVAASQELLVLSDCRLDGVHGLALHEAVFEHLSEGCVEVVDVD